MSDSIPYSGATGQCLTDFLGCHLNVKMFGAAGDNATDDAAAVMAAYNALPLSGGALYFPRGKYKIGSALNFATVGKPVLLFGDPGDASELIYTPTTGTCLTFNYGNNHRQGHGFLNLTITGPGAGTSTVGVVFGGTQGAEGMRGEWSKIQGFGTGLWLDSQTWIVSFRDCMIRANGYNVVLPSGLTNAGENIQFLHCTFCDAPLPHTNSVWVQGGGLEVVFTDCSFDQAQLRIGNGGTSAAQVTVKGCHFENPNFGVGGVDYDYIVMDNHNGNYLRLTDSYLLQDRTAGGNYPRFCYFQGGVIHMSGIGMYSPVALTNFAVLANHVNVVLLGFNDLSANITDSLYGGSTTGFLLSMPGANTGTDHGYNTIIGASPDLRGGAVLHVKGNIKAEGAQLVSTAPQGTAPLVVNSTTVVENLSVRASNVVGMPASGVTSVNASAGISVNQTTGAVTVTNTGVRSITAGAGISVNYTTGDVTITATGGTGVTSVNAGAGISVNQTTGAVTVTSTGVTAIYAGTGVSVDRNTGAVTITATGGSCPQDLSTTANPTFHSIFLTNSARIGRTTDDGYGSLQVSGLISVTPGAAASSPILCLLGAYNSRGQIMLFDGSVPNGIGLDSNSASGPRVNVTVGGVAHTGVSGETVSTSAGTRQIRGGVICVD